MVQLFKNIGVGFLVSFLGSVPLGYLNIVGYKIYATGGMGEVFLYLLGVISVEAIVIYCTLIFVERLIKNKKLMQWIEGFSVVFMFVIAYIFYAQSHSQSPPNETAGRFSAYPTYLIGVLLCSINFIQIPFWTGWNLYLLNGKHITTEKGKKYLYVFGTLCGTVAGMLTLILGLDFITSRTGFFSKYLMSVIIPLGFAAMGIYQGIQFYRKYFSAAAHKK
jgi:hypothetical protein